MKNEILERCRTNSPVGIMTTNKIDKNLSIEEKDFLVEQTSYLPKQSTLRHRLVVLRDYDEKTITRCLCHKPSKYTDTNGKFGKFCNNCSEYNYSGDKKYLLRWVIYKFLSDYKLPYSQVKNLKEVLLNQTYNNTLVYKIQRYVKYDVKENWNELLNKINTELEMFDSNSYKYFIYNYGKDIGEKLYIENNKKNSLNGKIEGFIERYGEIEGAKRYNASCDSKKHNYENYQKWYGEEADDKWEKFIELQKSNSTKEFLQDKWGDDYELKSKSRSTTSKEYWIEKGFSEEESEEKVSERQRTFTKEKCIDNFGGVEGLRIWQERQDKWQSTLNSKSVEEIEHINKKKSKTVTYIANAKNITKDEAVSIIDNVDWSLYRLYYNEIQTNTEVVYERYIDEIDPDRKRSSHYHLDHQYSRFMGFIFNIPPFILSRKHNLKILPSLENFVKGARCDITKEELFSEIN